MKPGIIAATVGIIAGAAIILFTKAKKGLSMSDDGSSDDKNGGSDGSIGLGINKKDLPLPDCSTKFTATKKGSSRQDSKIRLIVIHSTEGGTAAGAAGWFANDASGGSAHIVVDDKECYRTLPDSLIPWGAKGGRANEDGLHIEFTGYAKWTRDEWMNHLAEIKKGAAVISNWCKKYNIPIEFLDSEEIAKLGNNAHGITTHHELTKAFKIAGGHTDPGKGFPMDVLFDEMGADYKPNPYV
ncbi:MAG: N-acetylmuramoyl-L-alanine amidase [Erysipelothrix sp.]|nr:N-acetylmuramoyl-L-alanine amidase [Erysipelothrix sp.]